MGVELIALAPALIGLASQFMSSKDDGGSAPAPAPVASPAANVVGSPIEAKDRMREKRKALRSSTILTSPLGVDNTNLNTAAPTLLGQ